MKSTLLVYPQAGMYRDTWGGKISIFYYCFAFECLEYDANIKVQLWSFPRGINHQSIHLVYFFEVEIVKVGRSSIQMSCFYVFSCRGEEVFKANFSANTRGRRWWLPWELLTPRPQCWATAGMWNGLSLGGALEAMGPPPLCHCHLPRVTATRWSWQQVKWV